MDITSLLKKLKRWVAAQPDVVGVALIGSYACGTATEESDVDVIILTTEVRKYFRDKQWVSLFGEAEKPKWSTGVESRLYAPSIRTGTK